MKNEDAIVSIVDDVITHSKNKGILQLYAGDEILNGRTITIEGRKLVNFGSCSYLGLEMNPNIRQGVIEATNRYGTQFSASRAYVSAPPYKELQNLLSELFGAYPIISASTTMGHIATLPVLIGPRDALVMDQQVHNSVQLAASQCRLRGTPLKTIYHSNMDALEEAIQQFKSKGAKRIWYFADGLYSMYGDFAPLAEIIALLEKYDDFHVYFDDAHGMSWYGKQGRGTVLGSRGIHEKMVVSVSLNKAFAAAGGAIIFPNQEWQRKVMNCGNTLIFSGPVQPPMLGAALASARIHLSGEVHEFQNELHDKIRYCNQIMRKKNLPLLNDELSVIRFIGIGMNKVTINLIRRLMDEGYYTCLATFPAVSIKRTGVRITINRHLTHDDIKGLADALEYHLPKVIEEENYAHNFEKTFKNVIAFKDSADRKASISADPEFHAQYANTITEINKSDWDNCVGDTGCFGWNNLQCLEKLFSATDKPEENCQFHYFIVRNRDHEVVLSTFFITTLVKDDMFSPASVSETLEQERRELRNPHHFTSRALMMGSLLTEGNHLYLDKNKNWRGAMKLLFNELSDLQEKHAVDLTIFRDLPGNDVEMHEFMMEHGYIKMILPDAHVIENATGNYIDVLQGLPYAKRKFIRKQVLENEAMFSLEILDKHSRKPGQEELDYFYRLYKNVKDRGLEINVFDLPAGIFSHLLESDAWELMALSIKLDSGDKKLVSISGCVKQAGLYCPILIGLDYDYVKSHGVYRQALYQVIKRGFELKAKKIMLGLTASLQKRRFGAVPHEIVAYVQAEDNYKMEVLAQMNTETVRLVD